MENRRNRDMSEEEEKKVKPVDKEEGRGKEFSNIYGRTTWGIARQREAAARKASAKGNECHCVVENF
jgi:hypothetical protein